MAIIIMQFCYDKKFFRYRSFFNQSIILWFVRQCLSLPYLWVSPQLCSPGSIFDYLRMVNEKVNVGAKVLQVPFENRRVR
jgi:hypothetical protein